MLAVNQSIRCQGAKRLRGSHEAETSRAPASGAGAPKVTILGAKSRSLGLGARPLAPGMAGSHIRRRSVAPPQSCWCDLPAALAHNAMGSGYLKCWRRATGLYSMACWSLGSTKVISLASQTNCSTKAPPWPSIWSHHSTCSRVPRSTTCSK